jgi:hypothetical protein
VLEHIFVIGKFILTFILLILICFVRHEKDVGHFLLENFKQLKDSSSSSLDSKI